MRVELFSVKWGSYSEYREHKLSVKYNFINNSTEKLYGISLDSVQTTSGVQTQTQLPLSLGTLDVGGNRIQTISFKIPAGVTSFISLPRITFQDQYGYSYSYPEAPGSNDINVKDYGVAGNGVADDTASIQAVLNNAPAGSTVLFPSGTYKITAGLSVDKSVRLISYDQAVINQVSAGAKGFSVHGSGPVEFDGLRLTGPQYSVINGNEVAIEVVGSSAADPVTGVNVRDCQLNSWGIYGIYGQYVHDVDISNNNVQNIYYAGIMLDSVIGGTVSGNTIDNVSADGVIGSNAYGIAASRATGDRSLTVNPRSANLTIQNNTVRNVIWEGIDTHAGENIDISSNTLTHSYTGIAVVSDGLDEDITTHSPINVTVHGNQIDWGQSDGTGRNGIIFEGACSLNGPYDYGELATGSITNNTIQRHGKQGDGGTAGIRVYHTRTLVVANNTLIEESPVGIDFTVNNLDFSCYDNTMIDVWSNSLTWTYAVTVGNYGYNVGTITRTNMVRGTKTANVINYGMYWLGVNATNNVSAS